VQPFVHVKEASFNTGGDATAAIAVMTTVAKDTSTSITYAASDTEVAIIVSRKAIGNGEREHRELRAAWWVIWVNFGPRWQPLDV
jgi:hypothetical protein